MTSGAITSLFGYVTEANTGLLANASAVLTFITGNALTMVGIAVGLVFVGIRVIKRFIPSGR